MRVLMLERTILLSFLCNSLVIFLVFFVNRQKAVLRGLLFSAAFTTLDILALYVGNSVLFCVVIAFSIALTYFVSSSNKPRNIYITVVIVVILSGLCTMIPIKATFIKFSVMGVLAIGACGFFSQMFLNNYVNKTVAVIEAECGRFSALIDTGIICENAPMIVVSRSNTDIDISKINKYKHVDINFGTVADDGCNTAYIVPIVKVNVKRKSSVFFNTKLVITESELPCKAIISAMGLV